MLAASLLLAALPALVAARRASSPNSNIATLHSLDAYVADPWGARSLDGSPYEIWVARAPAASPNKNKWVIDIMGGA